MALTVDPRPPGPYVAEDVRDASGRAKSISQTCWNVWNRFDPNGLAEFVRVNGKIRVRVPVPRQRWPNRTMGD